MNTERTDVYARVTDQIVAAIEAGAGEYKMPWHHTGSDTFSPRNVFSKSLYRGVNILSLWAIAEDRGYTSGLWATYRHWKELGAQVRKDAKSALVVFWKVTESKREAETTEEEIEPGRTGLYATAYHVFNEHQVDGFKKPALPILAEEERIEKAETFFRSIPANFQHGGDLAYYRQSSDHVQMPAFGQFKNADSYYSVLAHELTHWTGAPSRLNRELGKRFGDYAYAMEELVAELGSAFVCASLDLANEPRRQQATYVASWLKALKSDKRAIFTAASSALAACGWLHREKMQAAA